MPRDDTPAVGTPDHLYRPNVNELKGVLTDVDCQKLINKVLRLIKKQKPLDEKTKRELLALAAGYSAAFLTLEVLSGDPASKARTRELNSIQAALERHQLVHDGRIDGEPVEIVYELALPLPREDENA